MMEMATYSLSSSFPPGTFLEMDLFFPLNRLGDSGKPTHFSLTWSCVTTTRLTHTFIFSIELRCVGQIVEMLKLQKGSGRGILVLRGWGWGVFTPSHPSRVPSTRPLGWVCSVSAFRISY